MGCGEEISPLSSHGQTHLAVWTLAEGRRQREEGWAQGLAGLGDRPGGLWEPAQGRRDKKSPESWLTLRGWRPAFQKLHCGGQGEELGGCCQVSTWGLQRGWNLMSGPFDRPGLPRLLFICGPLYPLPLIHSVESCISIPDTWGAWKERLGVGYTLEPTRCSFWCFEEKWIEIETWISGIGPLHASTKFERGSIGNPC